MRSYLCIRQGSFDPSLIAFLTQLFKYPDDLHVEFLTNRCWPLMGYLERISKETIDYFTRILRRERIEPDSAVVASFSTVNYYLRVRAISEFYSPRRAVSMYQDALSAASNRARKRNLGLIIRKLFPDATKLGNTR